MRRMPNRRLEWTSKTSEDLKQARVLFGGRVRKLRENRGIIQADLSRTLGISQKTLGGIEAGQNWPSLPVYIALCRALEAGRIPFISP